MSLGFGFSLPAFQPLPLDAQIAALFSDGVIYDPSDFNSSWRRNLLTYSEQFDNAAWTKGRASIAAANIVVAPDGTLTAEKLVDSTDDATHRAYQVVSGAVVATYTFSVYAKAAERTKVAIGVTSNNETTRHRVLFELSGIGTGQTVLGSGAFAIEYVGDGWYRCSVTGATISGDAGVAGFIYVTNNAGGVTYAGDGTSGIYIWGAQLELGTTASAYQKITDGVADYYVYGSPLPVLYQDSAGTTPVTALEQPVGLMLDKSRGLVLGPELIPQPLNFNSGWSILTATIDSSTTFSTTGAGGAVFSITPGKTYKISISGSASGVVAVAFRSPSNSALTFLLSSVNGTAIGTASSTETQFYVRNSTAGTTTVTSISIRELPGAHAFHTPGDTTTRPTLSRRINLLTKTEQFDDAVWTKTQSSVTPNTTTAPDGTLTASKLVASATNDFHELWNPFNSTSGTSYTGTYFVKSAEHRYVQLLGPAAVFAEYANFDLVTGTRTAGTSGFGSIQSVGNGWYRIGITASALSTSASARWAIALVDSGTAARTAKFTGDGTSGIYIWGASLVPADLAGLPYQRVNTTTDYDSDASKFPTFLRCDGVNDGMQTASIDFSATDKMFVSAGVRKLSDAARAMLVELGPGSGNGTFSAEAPNAGLGNYGGYFRGTSSSFYNSPNGGLPAPISNVLSGIGDISGDSAILRVNGAQAASSASDQGTGNYGNYPLYLFRRGGSSLPFNGWFYGGLIKGATLSASQIALVERWLASKTKTVVL